MFLLNLFLIGADSSGAVPLGKCLRMFVYRLVLILAIWLGTMLAIVALWFVISAPLSAIGAFFGHKHGVGFV